MKKLLLVGAFSLAVLLGSNGPAYSAAADIEGLVDNFYKATDLQRAQVLKDSLGKEISGSGAVSNVGEYDFFDTANDLGDTYYQVSLAPQKTKNNVPYQLILLFKDKNKVKDIARGEKIQKDGQIIRIIDERLQTSVWLFCGELTASDKALLKQDSPSF
jgi:mevalonate pyrophosphate decarboxylase